MGGRVYTEPEISALVAALAGAKVLTVATHARRVIRFRDVAAELGCCRATIRNLIARGKLRAVEIDTGSGQPLRLIDYSSFLRFLTSARPVQLEEDS